MHTNALFCKFRTPHTHPSSARTCTSTRSLGTRILDLLVALGLVLVLVLVNAAIVAAVTVVVMVVAVVVLVVVVVVVVVVA